VKSEVSDKKFRIRVDDWVSLLLAVKGGKQDFLNQSPGLQSDWVLCDISTYFMIARRNFDHGLLFGFCFLGLGGHFPSLTRVPAPSPPRHDPHPGLAGSAPRRPRRL
jgi:hypothetical protein